MSLTLEKTTDQRIVHPGCTWEQFKLIQRGFANATHVRLFFYQNTIEILMPGTDHEFFKSVIGMLVEMFLFERGIEFAPTGSVTQEREAIASAQADESYCIGTSTRRATPDLAIEVVFTSGSSGKLARYRAIGVPEVWFWQDGAFSLYHLRDNEYVQIQRSELSGLEDLDFDLLTRCILLAETSVLEAGRTFRAGILR